eukprot:4859957-Amphidinium_carterae.2
MGIPRWTREKVTFAVPAPTTANEAAPDIVEDTPVPELGQSSEVVPVLEAGGQTETPEHIDEDHPPPTEVATDQGYGNEEVEMIPVSESMKRMTSERAEVGDEKRLRVESVFASTPDQEQVT